MRTTEQLTRSTDARERARLGRRLSRMTFGRGRSTAAARRRMTARNRVGRLIAMGLGIAVGLASRLFRSNAVWEVLGPFVLFGVPTALGLYASLIVPARRLQRPARRAALYSFIYLGGMLVVQADLALHGLRIWPVLALTVAALSVVTVVPTALLAATFGTLGSRYAAPR